MLNEEQVEQLHERILDQIRKIRARHGACTARSVASELHMSPDVIRYRCNELREQGRVNWTDMPGSLHVVEDVSEQLAEAKAALGHSCAECGWPTEAALEMHRRRSH